MKINIIEHPPRPSYEVHFELIQNEFDMLREIFGTNMTIPKILVPIDEEKRAKFTQFMTDVYRLLIEK